MLHYRTASGLVTSTARGRYRDASGQSVPFGPSTGGGSDTFSFYSDADLTAAADTFEGAALTIGSRMYSTQNVYSVGLRYLAPTNNFPSNSLLAVLYDDVSPVGNKVKEVAFTLPELSIKDASGVWTPYWHEVFWPSPILIPALETWTHAVVTSRYVGRNFIHEETRTRGAITAPQNAGRFSESPNPPNQPFSQYLSSAYFIDGIYSLTI